jgi:hypothetical protein
MSFITDNRDRSTKKATSQVINQRSTCAAVFYRFNDPFITKLASTSSKNAKTTGGVQSKSGNVTENSIITVDNDIVRCNITKNKGSSSGTFSLTLKKGFKESKGALSKDRINYLEKIQPGDWVMIYMKKSGQVLTQSNDTTSGLKMIGIVENVRYIEVDDPNRGSPRLEYIITGRDFGKVLESSIYINPLQSSENGVTDLITSSFFRSMPNQNKTGTFSPNNTIKSFIKFYLGTPLDDLEKTVEQLYVPKSLAKVLLPSSKTQKEGISFLDVLNLNRIGLHKYDSQGRFLEAKDLLGATILNSIPSSGTVWSVLELFQDSLVNEMFTELVVEGKKLVPSYIFRQIPFSNKEGHPTSTYTKDTNKSVTDTLANATTRKTYFLELPRHNIVASDIKQKNIGKSEFERMNAITVVPRMDIEDAVNELFVSVFNTPSIQRYGLKMFQFQSVYASGRGAALSEHCRTCISLIVDWLFQSHALYNGTIITQGTDDFVGIGSNLYISDLGQLFHIEGYTHTYEVSAESGSITYDTEFRVSRGMLINNGVTQFIDPENKNIDSTTVAITSLENVRNNK